MQQDHFLGSIVESKLLKFNIVSQGKTKHQKEVTSRDIVNELENSHHVVADTSRKSILRLTDKIHVPLFVSLMCFKQPRDFWKTPEEVNIKDKLMKLFI